MISNTTKPTRGVVGKENPKLGRRVVARKAMIPVAPMQETWSSKGTMST